MLSVERITSAGLAILDAWGLGDLSMRRVADELGVKAGALYYHVPNKQSLLARIADVILASAPSPHTSDLAQWLREWSHGLRQALLAHRDGAELVASTIAVGLGTTDPTVQGRELLAQRGAPQPAATMATFLHFIVGHAMAEQTRSQLVALGVLPDFDEDASARDFSHGIEILVRGSMME